MQLGHDHFPDAGAVMTVAVARITWRLHENRSLKEKRRILKSMITRSRNRFNVSVAEVADQDLHQRATLGVAVVGSDHRTLNSLLDRIISYMDSLHLADLIDQEIELIPLG
jgi:uncharacterized protein